jgi:hypothetical protein
MSKQGPHKAAYPAVRNPQDERVRALRDAAAAVAAWDQPQEHWPEENRCDRATVRRLATQLRAMADSAEKRLSPLLPGDDRLVVAVAVPTPAMTAGASSAAWAYACGCGANTQGQFFYKRGCAEHAALVGSACRHYNTHPIGGRTWYCSDCDQEWEPEDA